jgi:hydroxylysine kinase
MAQRSGSVGVLEAPPPRFSSEVASIAEELYGIVGTAVDLGSERDQTFLIDDSGSGGVLKISNGGEDPAVLDLETRAILHVARVDPGLPVARPRPASSGHASGAAAYRTTIDAATGTH